MADHKTTDVAICPKCGNKQKMTVWAVVDGSVNTKTKYKIINGNFFDQKCKKCGETFAVIYPTLYEDGAIRTMIYYAQTPMQESVAIQTVLQRRDSVKRETDYSIRVTTAPEKWREKVCIADNGFDDRLVEIMKIAILEKLNGDGALGHIDDALCWYNKANGSFELEIFGDHHCVVGIRKDFYYQLESKCKATLNRKEPNPIIVDLSWALNFLDENNFRCV